MRDISKQDSTEPSNSTPIPCPHCGKPGVKPCTILQGRELPEKFVRCKKEDFSVNAVDLVFVMGSSLADQPASQLPNEVGATCHRVLVNPKGAGDFDLFGRQRRRMKLESKALSFNYAAVQKQLQDRKQKLRDYQNSLGKLYNQASKILADANDTKHKYYKVVDM